MAAELGGSFEGKLVEINGHGSLLKVAQEEDDGLWAPLPDTNMDGHKGFCVGFSEDSQEYTVQTFQGLIASVPEDYLSLWIPETAPEDGGFDLAWTEEAVPHAVFGSVVADTLRRKAYCVIQMAIDDAVLAEAASMVQDLHDFDRMREEAVIDYLGRDNCTKVKQMADDIPDEEPSGSLGLCDRYLSNIGLLLAPEAAEAFGYELIGRTSGFARIPCSKAEASALTPPYSDEEVATGRTEGFFQWVQSRKISMVLMLEGNGGELVLHPKPGHGEDIKLPLSSNKMVVFRHDVLSYTFRPEGASVALQTWLLTGLPSIELRDQGGQQKDYAENLRLTGPWQPEGEQALVRSLMVRMPGRSWGYFNYWNMFSAGCDCVLEWTNTRWETELYYEEDRDRAMMTGKSYMHHGGFLDETEFTCFDNSFFGLTEDETRVIYPGQRIVMEVGYESLFRAGYTRSQAAGEMISVQVGDVGPDWHSVDGCWPHMIDGGDFTGKRMGVNAGVTCTRLSHFLNLIGPTNSVATACSSSLVALNIAHHNMANVRDEKARIQSGRSVYERALVIGINTLMAPFSFMGQCGMGGTTYKGRSFTFDTGADGYQRGEGCSATFVQMNSDDPKNIDRLACVIGSAVNQDGRSASLTAPNGPSQAALCRDAMKMARLQPVEVTAAECHGTGTALGDPIEVGALRGVMQDRVIPILQTSAKAHIGHLEASAGTAGIIKCMMMCAATAGTPNCHLGELNPHLDVDGYPTIFTSEITDYGYNSGYSGVSSFGFGGANSRADCFASAKKGPHVVGHLDWKKVDYVSVTCPFDEGPMHFTDGRCIPRATSKKYKREAYHADNIRDEFANYDCNSSLYTGQYQLAPGEEGDDDDMPKDPIFIVGSWDRFREAREMEAEDDGTWSFHVALGDTRCERFQLRVNNHDFEAIYPVVKNGSMAARCMGPDDEGAGHYWLLDARDAQEPAGTVFRISLQWADPPIMRWEKVEMPPPDWNRECRHVYAVVGSWTGGTFESLHEVSTEQSVNTWECKVRIGMSGMEWFRFARDKDPDQLVYPAKTGCSEEVPVCGPDAMCNDKHWRIGGKSGEIVTIRLQVVDAHVTLTILSNSMGTRVMNSVEGPRRHSYYVSGTFSDWKCEEMSLDPETQGTFTYKGVMGESCQEFFHILADADPGLTYFPEAPARYPGESIVRGPEEIADGRIFRLDCLKPGAEFEIAFDLHAADKRKVVDVKWLTDRVDSDSMKVAFYNFVTMGTIPGTLADSEPPLPALDL